MTRPLGVTRLQPQPCPNCFHKLDAATPIGKDLPVPKPNDITVCIECQQILQFDDALMLHKRRFEELPEEVRPEVFRLIFTMKKHLPRIKAETRAQRN